MYLKVKRKARDWAYCLLSGTVMGNRRSIKHNIVIKDQGKWMLQVHVQSEEKNASVRFVGTGEQM
jgi:hypothetical protein